MALFLEPQPVLCFVQVLLEIHGQCLLWKRLERVERMKTWLRFIPTIIRHRVKSHCKFYVLLIDQVKYSYWLFLNWYQLIWCRCQGFVVPETKDACTVEPLADRVHIHSKRGDSWALLPVKGKLDTYTIQSVSFQIFVQLNIQSTFHSGPLPPSAFFLFLISFFHFNDVPHV